MKRFLHQRHTEFSFFIFKASWSRSVDLPIPGSPPMRITEPRTIPPPKTRFSSSETVFRRISVPVSTSVMLMIFCFRFLEYHSEKIFLDNSSTKVFHFHSFALSVPFGYCVPHFDNSMLFLFLPQIYN